jgi:hypothetical protein
MSEQACKPGQIEGVSDDMPRLIAAITSTMLDSTVEIAREPLVIASPVRPPGFGRIEWAIINHKELHPCQPVERAEPEYIWELYGDQEPDSVSPIWRDLDLLLTEQDADIEQRITDITQRLDAFYHEHMPNRRMPPLLSRGFRGETSWQEAAMLRAAIPAFRDRALYGEVRQRTANKVYRALVEDVMPYIADVGKLAEVIVASLLARRGAASFAFPASVREECSRYTSDEGKTFNHDLYQLPDVDADKVLLQVKSSKGADNGGYDQRVIKIHLYNLLAPAVLSVNYERTRQRSANNPLAFVDYLRSAFQTPSRDADAMLNMAAMRLDALIKQRTEEISKAALIG